VAQAIVESHLLLVSPGDPAGTPAG